MQKENKVPQAFRLSPEVSRTLDNLAAIENKTKTDILESSVMDYSRRNNNEFVILSSLSENVFFRIQQLQLLDDGGSLSEKGNEALTLLNSLYSILNEG